MVREYQSSSTLRPDVRALAKIRDENGTNIAPLFAKNSGQKGSLNRQLFRFTPIRRHSFSIATSTSAFTNTVFCHVSAPISRTKVSARRILARQTDLMYDGFLELIASSSWKSANSKSICS
jgi:hypothetical protein